MKIIRAKQDKEFVYFVELDNNFKGIKKGRLKRKEFFEWLNNKTKIYEKVLISFEKENGRNRFNKNKE